MNRKPYVDVGLAAETAAARCFASEDGGVGWAERPLPAGATQVYAMGCA